MSLSWTEMLVVLVVGLLVLGPKRLPKMARDVGRAFHQLQRMIKNSFDLD